MAKKSLKQNNELIKSFLLIAIGVIATLIVVTILKSRETGNFNLNPEAADYNPVIIPENFTTNITNRHFSLPVGLLLEYEGKAPGGERTTIKISIDGSTKAVMGVNTLVYRDREYVNGVLKEDTRDYLAQDSQGNVWYFGEDVDNYRNGVLVNHNGTWLAGVNGAKPGIWMKARPKVGEVYRQEYFPGVAEDMGRVISLEEDLTTRLGHFTDCLQIEDFTPLEPDKQEFKYYCPQIKALAMETEPSEKDVVKITKKAILRPPFNF